MNELNKKPYNFGWIPDTHDPRDYKYKDIKPTIDVLPDNVDLRKYCSKVEDQGAIGSCVAQALVGNMEMLQNPEADPNFKYWEVSRMFIYYNARKLEGTEKFDKGCMIRDAVKSMVDKGCSSERRCKYIEEYFDVKPSCWAYAEAKKHKISSYYSLTSTQEFMDCLASGFPFVFGIPVFTSFFSDVVKTTGVVQMPVAGDRIVGGHAILAVGYNMAEKRFLCRNSWGEAWGQKGYFTIPFDYVNQGGDDFWTVRK